MPTLLHLKLEPRPQRGGWGGWLYNIGVRNRSSRPLLFLPRCCSHFCKKLWGRAPLSLGRVQRFIPTKGTRMKYWKSWISGWFGGIFRVILGYFKVFQAVFLYASLQAFPFGPFQFTLDPIIAERAHMATRCDKMMTLSSKRYLHDITVKAILGIVSQSSTNPPNCAWHPDKRRWNK